MIFKQMMNFFRVSLMNQILFPLIQMQEVTPYIWTFGILLMDKHWFVSQKTSNPHDNYTVSIICNLYAVDHVPLGLSILSSNFLLLYLDLPYYALSLGKKIHRGARLKLELPVTYSRRGHGKKAFTVVGKSYQLDTFSSRWSHY